MHQVFNYYVHTLYTHLSCISGLDNFKTIGEKLKKKNTVLRIRAVNAGGLVIPTTYMYLSKERI